MLKKKYLLVILIIILMMLFAYFIVFFEDNFSIRAVKGQNNLKKISLIKLGMSEKQVVDIMGSPDKIIKDESKVFYYDINHIDYLDGLIYFDSNMVVSKIILPTEE